MTQTQPERRLLQIREVAALLRLPRRTVLFAAARGQLPLERQGRHIGIDEIALHAAFEGPQP